jgi:PhzF family phenazine biosynthesis protein
MSLRLHYRHVDVFARRPLGGNGLTVFELSEELPTALLQRIAQEMRQFESIFVWRTADARRFRARIFTMEEELAFAGHPLLGAACVLHERDAPAENERPFVFELPGKRVQLTSRHGDAGWSAEMDQGRADFVSTLDADAAASLLAAMNLSPDDLAEGLPPQVVSTGLPYLIVPLRRGLDRLRIVERPFGPMLARWGAKFSYALDVGTLEARSLDNDGGIEDIATGSAAGPTGAYLAQHGLIAKDEPLVLRQGRFLGRPSELTVRVSGTDEGSVRVSGAVAFVGQGHLDLPRDDPQR